MLCLFFSLRSSHHTHNGPAIQIVEYTPVIIPIINGNEKLSIELTWNKTATTETIIIEEIVQSEVLIERERD